MVLTKLDWRQEPGRHVETLDAITRYLEMGTYSEWDKEKKLNFLTRKLKGKSSLVHPCIGVPPDVKEVLDTFRIAAELGSDSPRAYVISRASIASDVLAVELLEKDTWLAVIGELGRACHGGMLRVVPLFETVKDLGGAGSVIRKLLSIDWYREHIIKNLNGPQEIMVGNSNSGKDVGLEVRGTNEASKERGIRSLCFKQWDPGGNFFQLLQDPCPNLFLENKFLLEYQPLPSFIAENWELQVQPADILDHRQNEIGEVEVRVKWQNLSDPENSWELMSAIQANFPDFHLEDKVHIWEESIDRIPGPKITKGPEITIVYVKK